MAERLMVSVAEAAEMLDLSDYAVRELCHQRRLRATRVGRRILIPRTAVEEFVANAEWQSA